MQPRSKQLGLDPFVSKFSIVIPTDFSNPLILDLINSIINSVPKNYPTEILLMENLENVRKSFKLEEKRLSIIRQIQAKMERQNKNNNISIKIKRNERQTKRILAICNGVGYADGENIIIMNDDFSHPPDILPRMMNLVLEKRDRLVLASRYANGGSVYGEPLILRLIGSGTASIARRGLKVKTVSDPISDYIAVPKVIFSNFSIDKNAHSLSLEILTKSKGLKVHEIPYCYKDNPSSRQKVIPLIVSYGKSIVRLYAFGPKSDSSDLESNYQRSMRFVSKAGRFYTVGASGLLLNYLLSTSTSNGVLASLWYMHATLIGIFVSIFSNFFLNKIWTFQDMNFSSVHLSKQMLLFFGVSSIGATLQIILVYLLTSSGLAYNFSLLSAVTIAAASNFLLNKKFTFGERLWE